MDQSGSCCLHVEFSCAPELHRELHKLISKSGTLCNPGPMLHELQHLIALWSALENSRATPRIADALEVLPWYQASFWTVVDLVDGHIHEKHRNMAKCLRVLDFRQVNLRWVVERIELAIVTDATRNVNSSFQVAVAFSSTVPAPQMNTLHGISNLGRLIEADRHSGWIERAR